MLSTRRSAMASSLAEIGAPPITGVSIVPVGFNVWA
jgi:hypothetical protein